VPLDYKIGKRSAKNATEFVGALAQRKNNCSLPVAGLSEAGYRRLIDLSASLPAIPN
jgi:hypothetical protein